MAGNAAASRRAYNGLILTAFLFAAGLFLGAWWSFLHHPQATTHAGTGQPFQLGAAPKTSPARSRISSSSAVAHSSPASTGTAVPVQHPYVIPFYNRVLFCPVLGWLVASFYWGVQQLRQQRPSIFVVSGKPLMLLFSIGGIFIGALFAGWLALPKLIRVWVRDIAVARRYLAERAVGLPS